MTLTVEQLKTLGATAELIKAFEGQAEKDVAAVLRLMLEWEEWGWFEWLITLLMTKPQRLQWAIYCAEKVLPIFEKPFPKDDRPRKAIKAAKNWLKNPSADLAASAGLAAPAAHATYTPYAPYADHPDYADAAGSAAAAAYSAFYDCEATSAASAAHAAYEACAAHTASAGLPSRKKFRHELAEEGIRILYE